MRTLPDYTVVRELGKGATATVYLAVQKSLNRRVALKVLGGGLASDATFTQRFLREGRIIAKLNHPHIVPVYDVGEHDGALYMAMECLNGGTLDDRKSELTLEALETCVGQITAALGYAHGQGFVHRDIKLDNILFRDNGDAVLGDFGIARAAESLTRMTMTGAILGTPAYMSPEQVAGRNLDSRADLYSLGVVLFELLSGHAPFQGDSVMSVGLQHITAPIPELPAAAAHFQPLIASSMAKKPEDRYATADEFQSALSEHIESFARPPDTLLSALHGDTVPQALDIDDALSATRQQSPARRWLLAGAAVAALVVTAVIMTQQPEPESLPPPVVEAPVDPEAERAQAELAALLDRGSEAERDNRWFGDDGAVALFKAALVQSPGNSAATDGLDRVRSNALQRAQLDILAGRFADAESALAEIDAVWPGEDSVATLRSDIADRRTSIAAASAQRDRDQRLADTLERASLAARNGAWVTPEDENALALYRTALSIDPGNAIGLAGVNSVATHFITRAEQAIATEELESAAGFLETAATIDAEDPRYVTATRRLAAAEDAMLRRQQDERAAAALAAQVDDLNQRIQDFIGRPPEEEAEGDAAAYEALSAELSTLAAAAPDDRTVQALRDALDKYQEDLAEQEDDSSRFDLPTF